MSSLSATLLPMSLLRRLQDPRGKYDHSHTKLSIANVYIGHQLVNLRIPLVDTLPCEARLLNLFAELPTVPILLPYWPSKEVIYR